MLVVKNYDAKKKTAKNCYLSIKVAKHSYQFAADSFKELREWAALIRQAIDNGKYSLAARYAAAQLIINPLLMINCTGFVYSGKVTEPHYIEEGTVNVKFNMNCIALACPITEAPIKKWRLDHITSFGQCGGILTFECCSICSVSSTARCCINIVQEKPSTILNLMEKAIRNNPNTGEIHYERSILGDIYHCDHDCCQTQKLLPAFSDPNIFRSSTSNSHKGITVPVDVHADFDIPSSTFGSNDSGLPGTPKQPDALSINSNIPNSPTGSNSVKERGSPHFRSPKHQHQGGYKPRSMSTTEFGQPSLYVGEVTMQYARRQSDETHRTTSSQHSDVEPRKFSDGAMQHESARRRLVYTAVRPNSGHKGTTNDEDLVTYSTVHVTSPTNDFPQDRRSQLSGRLRPLDENEGIYDIPNCEPNEPGYWDIGADSAFSPPTTPIKEEGSLSALANRKTSTQSTLSIYEPGSDIREREEDFEELPPIPKHNRRARPPAKEFVKLNGTGPTMTSRQRLHSTGDVLESRPMKCSDTCPYMGSMDNLDQAGRNRSYSLANGLGDPHMGNADLLTKLHEEDEMLTRVLAASRRERNEEVVGESQVYLSPSSHGGERRTSLSPISSQNVGKFLNKRSNNIVNGHLYSGERRGSLAQLTTHGVDKFLTKKASDTVRGYAYKIQIPLSNTEYDVPRRAAPAPNLINIRSDAPPKPLRRVNE